MHKPLFVSLLLFIGSISFAQGVDTYVGSIKAYQKKYITEHEVVKGKDKKYFRFC